MVLETGCYSFFHSANWARTLHESYGFNPVYFMAQEKQRVTALLPVMEIRSFLSGNRGVSLPFSDYCELIGRGEPLRGVVQEAIGYGKSAGWKYVELRGDSSMFAGNPCFCFHYLHTTDISEGPEKTYAALRDSTKRNIKKAVKEGVTVTRGTSPLALSEFCRLNSITRRQHGIPPQPQAFFERLHENVIAQGMGRVYLAYHGGTCIAGAVFVHFGDRALYKYGASDPSYQHLRGNNLVMWEAMRSYSEEGFSSFSFGRTEPGNEGLRQFKNGWGSREETVNYYRFNLQREVFETDSGSAGAGCTRIMARLPIPVLETIGKYLYRHVG